MAAQQGVGQHLLHQVSISRPECVQTATARAHAAPALLQGSVSCANPILLEVLPEFKSAQETADNIEAK